MLTRALFEVLSSMVEILPKCCLSTVEVLSMCMFEVLPKYCKYCIIESVDTLCRDCANTPLALCTLVKTSEKKSFIKMLKDVGMEVLKITKTRCTIQAGKG